MVVGVVGGEDEGDVVLGGELSEGGVTGFAGGGFEVGVRGPMGGVEIVAEEGDIEFFGETGDEGGVFFGLDVGAEVVLDVGDEEVEFPGAALGETVQGAKEGDGIGTATDSQEEAGVFGELAAVLECVGEGFDEGVRLGHDGTRRGHGGGYDTCLCGEKEKQVGVWEEVVMMESCV